MSMSSLFLLAAVCGCARGRRERKEDPESAERHASEEGLVFSGNYTYYTLQTSSDKAVVLTILLHSLDGDADLYVAGRNKKPTFDVEEHNFQSTTCGDDRVVVPAHFVREESPIVIGVYGKCSNFYLSLSVAEQKFMRKHCLQVIRDSTFQSTTWKFCGSLIL